MGLAMRIIFMSTKWVLLLANTWASLHFVSLTKSTPISPVMLCLAMAWDRFNCQWFVDRQGPRSKVPRVHRLSAEKLQKSKLYIDSSAGVFCPFRSKTLALHWCEEALCKMHKFKNFSFELEVTVPDRF